MTMTKSATSRMLWAWVLIERYFGSSCTKITVYVDLKRNRASCPLLTKRLQGSRDYYALSRVLYLKGLPSHDALLKYKKYSVN